MTDATHAEVSLEETIRLQEFNGVSDVFPGFNDLSHRQQQYRLQRLEPEWSETVSNIATNEHMSHLVDTLDPDTSPSAITASHIAVGDNSTDGGSEPSSSDTSLNNQLGSPLAVGSVTTSTQILQVSVILDETQYNDNDIAEAGAIHDSSGTLLNRALIGPRFKTSDKVFTIEIEFQYLPL
jgi:hypothetical protein